MCDYSLYEYPNRLAREGEELVTYRFPLGSIGLASPVEVEKVAHANRTGFWGAVWGPSSAPRPRDLSSVCAVCVPPGALLILKDISTRMQKDLRVGPEEGGTFIQTSIDEFRHRDAIQFANGSVIPLHHLERGQRVAILSLVPAGEFLEARQPHQLTEGFDADPSPAMGRTTDPGCNAAGLRHNRLRESVLRGFTHPPERL